MTLQILIAEDDLNLRRGLMDLLTLEGYRCLAAADGEEALELFHRHHPEFCILDVMMPKRDGLAVCRAIRQHNDQVPILFLTARHEEIDHVLGLEMGADDYVAKPFRSRELIARIRAIMKRSQRSLSAPPEPEADLEPGFELADLRIDTAALRAYREGREGAAIDLTQREVAILAVLHDKAGQVVSRDDLFDRCWGRDFMPNSRALDQQISVLRRKIEQDPQHPRIIKTVHGAGYRYEKT